jgi:RNA polymerase subunit RPABC4/transcription elongation factor Spt4
MSRFSEELKVIPRAARIVAAIAYISMTALFAGLWRFGNPSDFAGQPLAAKLLLTCLAGIFMAIYVLLIGYVNGDAKRRGMRYVMWTLLAIFIPNAIGIILYFILRDPPLKPCPRCSQIVRPGFTFCPHCGDSLQPTCPSCGKGVERGWSNCPRCGTKLPSDAPASSSIPNTVPIT